MITTGYERMDEEVVSWAFKNGYENRIVSMDLETKVVDRKFLSGETILSVAVSRREGGVHTELLVLDEESVNGEVRLLERLNQLLLSVRPVIVVGFNHRGYDSVLLSMKKRLQSGPGLWGISDMLGRAYMLDVMHASRFAIASNDGTSPKFLPLAKVLDHLMFSHLPLKRTKSLLADSTDKGAQIYSMWKDDKERFKLYAEGDSHDTLLVFEEIFMNCRSD